MGTAAPAERGWRRGGGSGVTGASAGGDEAFGGGAGVDLAGAVGGHVGQHAAGAPGGGPAHLDEHHVGVPGGELLDEGARPGVGLASTRYGVTPHGTSPTAMVAAESSCTTSGASSAGSFPSTRSARRAAARPRPGSDTAPLIRPEDQPTRSATRAAASSTRATGRRPDRTAATIPPAVASTRAASTRAPRQSRSAPASSDRTAASGTPCVALAPFISSA